MQVGHWALREVGRSDARYPVASSSVFVGARAMGHDAQRAAGSQQKTPAAKRSGRVVICYRPYMGGVGGARSMACVRKAAGGVLTCQ